MARRLCAKCGLNLDLVGDMHNCRPRAVVIVPTPPVWPVVIPKRAAKPVAPKPKAVIAEPPPAPIPVEAVKPKAKRKPAKVAKVEAPLSNATKRKPAKQLDNALSNADTKASAQNAARVKRSRAKNPEAYRAYMKDHMRKRRAEANEGAA